jgi:hypothetical protein
MKESKNVIEDKLAAAHMRTLWNSLDESVVVAKLG